MTNKIRQIGMWMISNGIVVMILGAGVTVLFPIIAEFEPPRNAEDRKIVLMMSIFGGIFGLIAMIVGFLNIIGGIQAKKFRSRTLVLVALGANVVSFLAFGICGILSLILMILGLIAILSDESRRIFKMGAKGHSVQEILDYFAPDCDDDYDDDEYDRDQKR